MRTFGDNLKEIRNELGLTQKQFGEKLGFDARTICNWEKSRNLPSIYIVKHMSIVFNLPISDFFEFEDQQ